MNKTLSAALLALTAAPIVLATEGLAPNGAGSEPAPAKMTDNTPSTKAKAPAASKKRSAQEAAVIEKFVSLQDAAISTFLQLGKTLRGVTDKESADAAAPTVKEAGEKLFNIISAVEALGEPSEAAQQAIMARVANVAEKNEMVEQVMVPLLTLMMQNPPCYGSTELTTELGELLTNLQGAAGVEEEDVAEKAPAPLQEPDGDEAAGAPSSK